MGRLVSIVIPTYNNAHILPHAIDSALAQTMSETEIIVSDDGSTDTTANVAQTYQGRVKYTRIAHAGLPALTRNAGLRHAEGDYIAFLDADDTWLPEKLEKQLAVMRKNNCLASSANAWRVREGEADRPYFNTALPERQTLSDLLATNLVICSSAVVHHSILRTAGYFPEAQRLRAIEDYALWLRVASQTSWAYLSEPLLHYKDMPTQSVRRESVSVYEQNRRALRDFKKWGESVRLPGSFQRQVQRRLMTNAAAEIKHSIHRLLPGGLS